MTSINSNRTSVTESILTSPVNTSLIIRVSMPHHGLQKSVRCGSTETILSLKLQIMEKVTKELPSGWNYAIYYQPTTSKTGKFLDDRRSLFSSKLENNVLVEFIPKTRIKTTTLSEIELNSTNKKRNKSLIEEVAKGSVERVRDKLKTIDPNCWADDEGRETPLISAILNDDKDMILTLIEYGAHLDYRLGAKDQWKSPLHIACANNKLKAVQILIAAGAWTNIPDSMNLTPLYFSATNGHIEITHRLLACKANTEVYDENERGPLHQACLNNHHQVAWLLIDFGANMNCKNISGNTPLHISATRNSVECAQWLLLRGASRDILNKTNQRAAAVAQISRNTELSELIANYSDEDIIPPPPKPQYEDKMDMQINSIQMSPTSILKAHKKIQSASTDRLRLESGNGSSPELDQAESFTESTKSRFSLMMPANEEGKIDEDNDQIDKRNYMISQ